MIQDERSVPDCAGVRDGPGDVILGALDGMEEVVTIGHRGRHR
jgi:hypothetical protein